MPFQFGRSSETNLVGVHPDLQLVVRKALTLTSVDFMVSEGVRTDARCFETFGKGRTAAQMLAVGAPMKYAQPKEAMVTKVKNPLNTKHRKQGTGYGHAVDLLPDPFNWGHFQVMTPEKYALFDEVSRAMFEASRLLSIPIRWGADWDQDGKPRERGESDNPHFELDR